MEASTWIAIYMPIYILLFVIRPSQIRNILLARLLKKRRGVVMTNELVKRLIGKRCTISTGSMGSTFKKAKILNVVDNWISVEINGREDLINADYVQYIKVVD
ncbi:hypothetical protein SAMN02745751_01859 [Dethiosulfatibacter aminovorans DSM 17477]|uniref:Preprotein translocase subunit YajC n=1 Tax=Dethiosulfatibacter aminovorans DSM 17477 TaxID=1121476 RepID=A0A1M6GZK0_9FIRM|nr:hypothetical protein [Dethiosulfatibacter aminovorans]SHJ15352.1 hypothetical protein SAMN02745751_01859 [Dethiosulfatibacter aminovorans DSM 17477]